MDTMQLLGEGNQIQKKSRPGSMYGTKATTINKQPEAMMETLDLFSEGILNHVL